MLVVYRKKTGHASDWQAYSMSELHVSTNRVSSGQLDIPDSFGCDRKPGLGIDSLFSLLYVRQFGNENRA